MYEKRVCAFVDLLGFRSLVDRSMGDADKTLKILAALESLQPGALADEMYARVNREQIPSEELETVLEAVRAMRLAMEKQAEVRVSYFSDCIFVSADADNVIASQLIVDRLAELSVTMWTDHQLLLRGGITLGELVHVPNGPVFGPALVCAYLMESKQAIHPRIIIDQSCLEHFRQADNFDILESMFEAADNFSYMSLATALRFHINDSALVMGPPPLLAERVRIFKEAPQQLEEMAKTIERDDVRAKYTWLLEDFGQRTHEVIERPYLDAFAKQ